MQAACAATLACQRVFAHYASRHELAVFGADVSDKVDAKVRQYREWLQARFDSFFERLLLSLRCSDMPLILVSRAAVTEWMCALTAVVVLQITSLKVAMKFVEMQGRLQRDSEFHNELFVRVVRTLLHAAHLVGPLLGLFVDSYLHFDDVRYFTCRNVRTVVTEVRASAGSGGAAAAGTADVVCRNAFELLLLVQLSSDTESGGTRLLVPLSGIHRTLHTSLQNKTS